MTVFDLLFLITIVIAVTALLRAAYALVRGRRRVAPRILLRLGVFLGVYAAALIAVSVTSAPHVLGLHQPQCFDEWCLTVERVAHRQTIGHALRGVVARGRFYLVTVQVSNKSKRTSQRAIDAQVYLVATTGRRYDPAPGAQAALDVSGRGGQPLDTEMPPGGAFTRTVVFDLPRTVQPGGLGVIHGLFPTILIIAHPQSFLHKPAILALPTS